MDVYYNVNDHKGDVVYSRTASDFGFRTPWQDQFGRNPVTHTHLLVDKCSLLLVKQINLVIIWYLKMNASSEHKGKSGIDFHLSDQYVPVTIRQATEFRRKGGSPNFKVSQYVFKDTSMLPKTICQRTVKVPLHRLSINDKITIVRVISKIIFVSGL